MNLTFTEINDYSEDTNIDTNIDNYWETPKQKPKKKKVNFTDILSNMNLVVNNQGVLQYMMPGTNGMDSGMDSGMETNGLNSGMDYGMDYGMDNNKINGMGYVTNNQPIDPNVKHSYIYNKYFKDYKDLTMTQPEVKIPKTIEEYNQMVLEDRIKRIQQQRRATEIKSTKLMFTTNPYTSQNPTNIKPSTNSLRKMSFR